MSTDLLLDSMKKTGDRGSKNLPIPKTGSGSGQ